MSDVNVEACESCPKGGYCDECFYQHSEAREHRTECRCKGCIRWAMILTARIHEMRVMFATRALVGVLEAT